MYSTLFSTGLHLQNSLLKLRHMEGVFEALEKSKDKESVSSFKPSDKQVLDWLRGFQDIQTELNQCLTCLDDGVEEMETIARPSTSSTNQSDSEPSQAGRTPSVQERKIDENDEMARMEEVFEAFISCDFHVGNLCFEDDFVTNLTESEPLERECESVGAVREAKHLTRQDHIEDKMDLENGKDIRLPASLVSTNVLGIFSNV